MTWRTGDNSGFTLIEIVVVILVIGVIATIVTLRMGESIETARFEQTKKELDQLAFAVAGNPDVHSKGARDDFGFVGDNGTLPRTLDDLVQNPGSWTTWHGPYVDPGPNGDDFKRDAWNVDYTYSDTLIRSTGSGANIDKLIAPSLSALLSNTVTGLIVDANMQPPTITYADSVLILLTCPNGSGSMVNRSTYPDSHGHFSYTGVPIGNHTLRVIYLPATDTVTYAVTVYPNRIVSLDIVFPADLW